MDPFPTLVLSGAFLLTRRLIVSQVECVSPAHRTPPPARCHPESSCANVTFTFSQDIGAMVRPGFPRLPPRRRIKANAFVPPASFSSGNGPPCVYRA